MAIKATAPSITFRGNTFGAGYFNTMVQELLTDRFDQFKYVRISADRNMGILRFEFILDEYEEGDAKCFISDAGTGAQISTIRIFNFLGIAINTVPRKLILYPSVTHPNTAYAQIQNKPIKNELVVDNFNWEKINIRMANTNMNVIPIRITPNTTKWYIVFAQYIKFNSPYDIYIDYDDTIDKAIIVFNHKFHMGFPIGFLHKVPMHKKPSYQFSVSQLATSTLFEFYGLIMGPVSSVYYVEFHPHPTREGAYVIERIFNKQACLVKTACEND